MRGHRRLHSRDPELCKAEAGIFEPVIDPLRCTAEGPCIKACPFDVLALRQIPAEQRADYPWLLRMRLAAKGGRQAVVIDAEACRACGYCVSACPEEAIRLRRRSAGTVPAVQA